MRKTIFIAAAVLVTGASVFVACKKHEFIKQPEAQPYLDPSFNYESVNNLNHSVTNAAARLGRTLFYDKRLSQNNTIACASCHKQEFAFADNKSLSDGFNGGKTGRNSMTIINAINSQGFFWDNRTIKLEDMVLQPIKHQVEMGLDNSNFLVEKLTSTSYYPQLFEDAFGSRAITKENIGKALAQFIYAMFAANSKMDQSGVLSGGWQNNNGVLTPLEFQGSTVFGNAGCASCHGGRDLRGWSNLQWGNIGLDSVYADKGLGALLMDPTKDGVFKVPSLRNVGLTAPYMHDGRYSTLEEVVEHYSTGIVYSETLSDMLKEYDPVTYQPTNKARKFNFSDSDKQALVAFLKTMTDYSTISDPKFSDPFKH